MPAGRTYVLTGGATGIGLATAHRLLDGGARLIVVDRSAIPADLAARGPTALRADLTEAAALESLVARIVTDQPRLSGIIASDGLTAIGLVHGLLPALELEAEISGAADVIVLGAGPDESAVRGAAVSGTGSAATRSCSSHLRAELGPRGIRAAHIATGYARCGRRGLVGDAEPGRSGSESGTEDGRILPEDYATVIAFILQQPAGVIVDDLTLAATAQG